MSVKLVALLAAAATSALSAQTRLGSIDFPTSGPPAAQQEFVRGVLYMHSFEYNAARSAFQRAAALAPDFAMAYWGEAMTHAHPVWNQLDTAAGRAALARLAPDPVARRAKAATAREQGYLDAVEVLYGEGTKASRDTAYAAAMEQLAAQYPDDLEAQAFYALSLLGLHQGVRDVPTYMRAGAIALEVFRRNPDHPGAAHYIIHAFDDPTHAPLGLHAARAYVGIAPGAAHAQHMTTHIFLSLGMWDEVVRQNEVAAGPDPTQYRPGHYTTWLAYGYLQQGRYADASKLLQTLRANAATDRARGMAANLTARYVIDTERWDGPEARSLTTAPAGEDGYAYAAERALEVLAPAAAEDVRAGETGDRVVPVILERELRSALRLADGAGDEAVALLRSATALEDGMPFEFGPPVVVKPSHELLGETLLALGRPVDARRAFARALELAPKRALSLRGLARSAAAAGDSAAAERAAATLRAVWHRADPELQATR